MSTSLSRAQRRRLERATDEADGMVQADDRFFERFPHRRHRVRLASRAEMEANRIVARDDPATDEPGMRWYCAVKCLAAGVRCRIFIQNDPSLSAHVESYDERHARIVYDLAAPPGSKAAAIEQDLLAFLKKQGGQS